MNLQKAPKFRSARLSPSQMLLYDAAAVIPKSDVFGLDYVNAEALEAFRRLWAKRTGLATPTPTMCVIRACAIALDEFPQLQHFITRTRRYVPASTDLGVTILGSETVHPVVVLRDAGHMSLSTIVQEFPRRMREAMREQRRDNAKFDRIGRWLPILYPPFHRLRRWIIKLLYQRPEFIWRAVGTFHITGLGTEDLELGIPFFRTTTSLFVVGTIGQRPIAENGQVVVRPVLPIGLATEHRAADPRTGIRFLRRVKMILEDPEKYLAEEVKSPVVGRAE